MASVVAPLQDLFGACKADSLSSLPPDSWYPVTVYMHSFDLESALYTRSHSAGPPPQASALVTPLSQAERRIVNRRFREFGLKQWVTIGIPKVAVAMFSVSAATQPGDAEINPPKKFRTLGPSIGEHGDSFLAAVYSSEGASRMIANWDEDSQWLTREVVYGLFYSDDGVLNYLETELLTCTAIVCQQPVMALPMANHLNGLRRMGLDKEQCENVTRVASRVAEWMGVDTKGWKAVGDVVDWDKEI